MDLALHAGRAHPGDETEVRTVKRRLLTALTLIAVGGASIAIAGDLEETCRYIHERLRSVKGGQVTKSQGEFTHDSRVYRGCVVQLQGDRKIVTGAYDPSDLFYPFPGSLRYRQGWRADQEADGPDGTSFRLFKGNTFCLVEGQWDGGDDADPAYVPATKIEVAVRCSTRPR